ncbi:hypothetical protein [Tardiphaga sp.]|uniref:DUF6894 family protein n=1 Tax=Tardiphaga sp. TaxID=1926292 RepID=UPI00262D392E|nr:hypothetical protein [Tardiphaga sp.]MDB5616022.1 hypothetical protein [Tardiphaga sp.]
MTKYHFEIVDGYRLEDPVGFELPSEDQARAVAQEIAKQIAIDISSESTRNVVVVDEDGKEVFKTPIKGDPAA